ncbi:MAG: hypothetical protein JG718_06390 [Candidatus Thiothrix moscowensis]|nr:hypothetical protein [Candidatus Thiothrix moscowensis]
MYQDWKQWARLCYAMILLALVWWLIKPEQITQFANWQEAHNIPDGVAFLQVSMFAISAGLIFPKARRFENSLTNDTRQFAAGLGLSALAWLMALL